MVLEREREGEREREREREIPIPLDSIIALLHTSSIL